jgi:pimeloyl-ACP methyl ester carboxylesterase
MMTYLPVPLSYEEHGEGTPVMLVHGFPLNRTIWYPLIPFLEGKARLILPDLRGHGQSPAPEGTYSMRLLAEDLHSLLDSLNIEKVILGGHSMGGYASLAFAQAYPHRLAGLAMIASQAAADNPERRANREKTAEEIHRRGLKPLAQRMAPALTCRAELVEPVRKMILKSNPKAMISALRGMAERPDAIEWLAEITVPTVVIAGSEDRLVSPERGKLMAQLLGRGWLVELPGAAHLPMMEQPLSVANALLQLITSV